jgi:glucuronate isomerase
MTYLSEDFLLHSKTAQTLYHEYAEPAPILDYHCHLSPQAIADDVVADSITQVWLGGDHYKWRAMRTNGIDENFITGSAGDEEKFAMWAKTMPAIIRNPLYDWAHLELKRYFDVSGTLLSPETAAHIYAVCNEKIKDKNFSAKNLLRRMNVKVVCTTDDPIDSLAFHEQVKRDGFEITMLPTFRPDKTMAVDDPVTYNRYLDALSAVSNIDIVSYDTLLEAVDKRHEYFHLHGCRCADHALETLSEHAGTPAEIAAIFSEVRAGKTVTPAQSATFKAALMIELCKMNHHRGWVQQIHIGVIRNVRTALYKKLGPDTGLDCIGDSSFGRPLCRLLDALDTTGQLTKTILFNINPGDNEQLVTIAGAFQDGLIPGKIQLGPAWWFLDQKDGMVRQMEALSVLGLLSRFVGMTTDSRSLLSFPRHEYFRRILCNVLGGEMENGDLPGDMKLMGSIVSNICFNNAREYFKV